MEEENKVQQVTTKEPQQVQQVTTKESQQVQQVTTKEPQQVQQVTTKDPKKVEVGKRLAEYNRKKRKEQKGKVSQYYGIEAVLAVGVIITFTKPRKLSNLHIHSLLSNPPRLTSLKWSNLFCIIKWTRRL